MRTQIAYYNVNRFTLYVIYNSIFLIIFIYILIINNKKIELLGIIMLVVFIIGTLFDVMWLLFGKIQLSIDKEQFVIQKKLFDIKLFNKKIPRPFDVELVYDLKSDYYLARNPFNWFTFYHKTGLRFMKKNGVLIYEIGLNDNIDAKLIFDKIK
ncbi:hypothetical protein D1815_02115 [Aquimarina sp. AD1]|uniref:hypothetical protein n=2 Tax=Aquimarina sp. (strain AD1) TaxID=1714848 RepID=UPI000E52853D|nr:hypothetical protein [Aquimarina sp. AD1]AXT54601.1 hypothetical protein D1815_02115 [Aquimarina sp. AD1]